MRHALLPLALLALCACTPRGSDQPAADTDAETPAANAATASTHEFHDGIDAGDFAEHVQQLSSDAFGGRGPGTPGEEKSVEYIKAQFARIGLQPGNGGDWFQTVPMVETTADESATLNLSVAGAPQVLKFGSDMVVGTRTGQAQVSIKDSPLVFVGYGVDAPEQQWNDYAGIDVKGKTVVMLVNDPGFHAGDAKLFDGKRMTYYGRWTYKFEEAARKGAAAALIIHDTDGASYGWDVVRNSWSGPQYDLPAKDDPTPHVPVQGWISGEAADALFKAAGQDLGKLRTAANKRGFKPVLLDATASLQLKSHSVEKQSRNVIGMLPGSEAPVHGASELEAMMDRTRLYRTIWRWHFYAGLFVVPMVLFLAVTLEESGLLGSKYYVAHPVVPLEKTVAVFNLDALAPVGRASDLTVVGKGSSQLEDLLKVVLDRQGRHAEAEDNTAAGYYFRSDHFNFAKAGVPALYIDSGIDLVEGGKTAGQAAGKAYTEQRYHKPGDQYDTATWKLDGIVQDLGTVYDVGETLANNGAWPNWYDGNPFKAARDRQRPAATP
jgi:Zn-dependent M28 family amino/carboxypeptidase